MSQIPTIPSFKIIGREIKLGEKIGSGANGDVYVGWPLDKSKHFPFPAKFAIKVIRKELCSPEFLQAVERELDTGRELKHPYIVQYIGSWVELQRGAYTGCYCLALHYCDGGDLHSLIATHIEKKQLVPNALVVKLMAHVFSALNYSHSKKIIHRDMKPANVFLVRKSSGSSVDVAAAMVGDYGLARPLEKTVQMVATRVGTPCYCSPEIVAGETYTVKTDIFSTGVMFYEVMMQERPFWKRGYSDRQSFYDILNKDPVPALVSKCAGHYDDGLIRIVSLCLAKHECHRPSAHQVLTGIYSGLHNFVIQHKIPLVAEKNSTAATGTASATSPKDAKATTAVREGGADSKTVQRLVRRFRDVVPHESDDAVLILLNQDTETYLLLKVLTATRAGDPEFMRSGMLELLTGVDVKAPAEHIVELMTHNSM